MVIPMNIMDDMSLVFPLRGMMAMMSVHMMYVRRVGYIVNSLAHLLANIKQINIYQNAMVILI